MITEERTELRLCGECNSSQIEEKFHGDEGWSVCEECGTIEGSSKYIFIDDDENYYCEENCPKKHIEIEQALKCNCYVEVYSNGSLNQNKEDDR